MFETSLSFRALIGADFVVPIRAYARSRVGPFAANGPTRLVGLRETLTHKLKTFVIRLERLKRLSNGGERRGSNR